MDNYAWPEDLLHFKLKSKRQKGRLLKTDRDKQLIRLNKREDELWDNKENLPMVPLEDPYQKGWKRTFVLRDDVSRSNMASFYQTLLEKINTIEYSKNKAFKVRVRRRRKRKKVYEDVPQFLRHYNYYEWHSAKLKLTDDEKVHFHPEQFWSESLKCFYVLYLFNDPWRYTLQISPRIITEVKMLDNVLEQEMAELDNYINRNCLRPRISLLTNGRGYNKWKDTSSPKPKHVDPYKNKPFHSILNEYEND